MSNECVGLEHSLHYYLEYTSINIVDTKIIRAKRDIIYSFVRNVNTFL